MDTKKNARAWELLVSDSKKRIEGMQEEELAEAKAAGREPMSWETLALHLLRATASGMIRLADGSRVPLGECLSDFWLLRSIATAGLRETDPVLRSAIPVELPPAGPQEELLHAGEIVEGAVRLMHEGLPRYAAKELRRAAEALDLYAAGTDPALAALQKLRADLWRIKSEGINPWPWLEDLISTVDGGLK